MLRNKQALIPYLLLLLALAGGVLWHESRQVPGLGRVVTTGVADVGGPFHLVDHTGKAVTEQDFRGRYMLIYFGYSFCPDVCPTTLGVMAEALQKLGSDSSRVVPIFITIDPERDTPELLKGYVGNFGPTFIGLTGTPDQIAQVARAYRVYYQKVPSKDGAPYLMDHSSIVYLLDRNGRFVTHFTHEAKAEQIAAAVQKLL
jgi:protein SCO1/2